MSRPKGKRRLCVTRGQWRDRALHAEHQLAGAGHLIEGLRLQIEELEAKLTARDEADKARHAQKVTNSIDIGVLQQQLAGVEDAYEHLIVDYHAIRADLENATAIDVPPMERDTDGLDQITEPIYAALWRQQFAEQEQAAPEVKTLTDALGGAR